MTKEALAKPRHRYHLLSEYDFALVRASGFSNTQLWNHFNQERFRLLIKMIRRESIQRKPLTDEQMFAIARQVGFDSELMKSNHDRGTPSLAEQFARAIEAAHGIKGEA